jgi:hypothetical protein
MAWDCGKTGHIEVDRDRTCLVCELRLIATDSVGMHITRSENHDMGEMRHPEDKAHGWGPADNGQQEAA